MKRDSQKELPTSVEVLEEQATILTSAGKYKDAIRLYKKLLQRQSHEQWHKQLAYCYCQSSFANAAKDKVHEAIGLWQNYSQLSEPPYQGYDQYLSWLIQTQNLAKVHECLRELTAQQLEHQYPAFAALLGMLIISNYPDFLKDIPKDSYFVKDARLVQSALQAYQENQLQTVEKILRQLPYRSAFRDFRTLLKAVLLGASSHEAARAVINKIPLDSVYASSARLIYICTLSGADLAMAMASLTHQQRELVAKIVCLTDSQFDLIERLNQLNDRRSDKIQFNLVLEFTSHDRPELSKSFCLAMLGRYPNGQREFKKVFGPVDKFEENRIKALTHESNNNDYDARYHWQECIKALAEKGSGQGLKIALILRHIAKKQADETRIQTLNTSLKYDPDDRDSALDVLNYLSQHAEKAVSYKKWLRQCSAKFPQDIAVLTIATQNAISNNDQKKASQYAQKILIIDSLNIFAKDVLFAIYLSNARRLMLSRKYRLAGRKLQQAEALKIAKNDKLQTQLLRGYLKFTGKDKQQGQQLIIDSLNKLHTSLVSKHFHASVEALLTNMSVADILRELEPLGKQSLSEDELICFASLLKQYAQDQSFREALHAALEIVLTGVKNSIQFQDVDEDTLLMFCHSLMTIQHVELIGFCARYAYPKWQKPIWLYYRVYSESKGDPATCTYANCLRLEKSLLQARLDNDQRTVILIESYLQRYYEAHPKKDIGSLGIQPDKPQSESVNEPLDKLFGHIPDETFYKINKKIDLLAKKTTPEQLIQELNTVGYTDHKILNAMMKMPDLYTALMVLRAALALKLNLSVSVVDVLVCFGVEK
jgi:hypothetical protein